MHYLADCLAKKASEHGIPIEDAVHVGKSILDYPDQPVSGASSRISNKLMAAVGFTYKLLPHQQVELAALIELMNNNSTPLPASAKNKIKLQEGATDIEIESNCTYLQADLGSGKTIMTIAAILLQKIPEFPGKILFPGMVLDNNAEAKNVWDAYSAVPYMIPTEVIPIAIVYVAIVTIDQWYLEFKKFAPHLRVLVIASSDQLLKFSQTYMPYKTYPDVDVILIAQVETYLGLKYQKAEEVFDRDDKMSMLGFLMETFQKRVVGCVFYDDFEVGTMPKGTQLIYALHHVFLSGSRNINATIQPKPHVDYDNFQQALDGEVSFVTSASLDALLPTTRIIKCDSDFLKQSVALPKIEVYRVVVSSADDNMIGAIAKLKGPEVQEKLNAGACFEVISMLGIGARTVKDLFGKLFTENYEMVEAARREIHFLEIFEQWWMELPLGIGDYDINTMMSISAQEAFHKCFKTFCYDGDIDPETGNPTLCVEFERLFEQIASEVPERRGIPVPMTRSHRNDADVMMKIELANKRMDTVNKTLSEFISNDTMTECPFCSKPFQEASMKIYLNCCRTMGCECTLNTVIKSERRSGGKGTWYRCPVPHCTKPIKLDNLIAYGNDGRTMQDMIADTDDSQVITDIQDEKPKEEEVVDPYANEEPKMRVVMRIIKRLPVERNRVEMTYSHVMHGMTDCGPPPIDVPCKPIISAGYEETVNNLIALFTKYDIKYTVIRKGTTDVHKIIHEWNEYKGTWALILLAYETCAGLNCQQATDLIFVHRINNNDVASQLIGRIQRPGRPPYNAIVWEVRFNNESNNA